jgi:hypothetical protein
MMIINCTVQYSISLLRVVLLQFLDVATSLWIFLGQFGHKSKQRQAKLKQKIDQSGDVSWGCESLRSSEGGQRVNQQP